MALSKEQAEELEYIDRTAQVMAKGRLSRLKISSPFGTGTIELEMSPLGFSMPEPVNATNDSPGGERMPTEEELLLWSAGGPLPDVEAKAPKEDA